MRFGRISSGQGRRIRLTSAHTMIVRPLVFAMLLAIPAPGAPALKEIPAYLRGLEALNAGLWEVAESRFDEALKTPDLAPADQRILRLRQLETWIRDDRSAEALVKLNEPAWANDPETYFWKSQAQAGLGRSGNTRDRKSVISVCRTTVPRTSCGSKKSAFDRSPISALTQLPKK